MPVGTDDGVYTLIIDKNGDADSVGSPGPYSPLGEDETCFGSIKEDEEGFKVKLDCHSLDDLKGAGRPYRGTATVEALTSADPLGNCDEGPGVLAITWDDADQEALCRVGDA